MKLSSTPYVIAIFGSVAMIGGAIILIGTNGSPLSKQGQEEVFWTNSWIRNGTISYLLKTDNVFSPISPIYMKFEMFFNLTKYNNLEINYLQFVSNNDEMVVYTYKHSEETNQGCLTFNIESGHFSVPGMYSLRVNLSGIHASHIVYEEFIINNIVYISPASEELAFLNTKTNNHIAALTIAMVGITLFSLGYNLSKDVPKDCKILEKKIDDLVLIVKKHRLRENNYKIRSIRLQKNRIRRQRIWT